MRRDSRRSVDASPTRLVLSDPLVVNSGASNDNDEDFMSPVSSFAHSGGRHGEEGESNFKVVIRVRPPVPRELEGYRPYVDVVRIPKDGRSITLCETLDSEDGRGGGVYSRQTFTFDYVYDKQTPQREVYERSAQPAVLSVLEGYNATLMAYGQTGTGKTYTMEGFTSEEQRGIIPRSIEEVFAHIHICRQQKMHFLVRASYMQIYNEVISDLLKPSAKPLSVRHTPQRGVYVEGLSEWIVRTPQDVYGLIERGTSLRATSTTRMSELSSRSHAMFTIIVEVMEGDESNPISYRFGKLNIVDLAGSEKVRQAGVTGQRLEETKKINKSLHELGNVISALASKTGGRNRHIPFRNSVLTSALRDSLGGNCKTTLIACISPALESYTESLSTLVFANRAKNIKNTAVINEDVDQDTLLRRYEHELKLLRQQLQERAEAGGVGGGAQDATLLSELRQGKQRAEEDREAALEALHESSRAHQQEQLARRMLEERILEMEGMLQNGGFKGGPRTSDEYALRLDELDRERQVMEEDKAQVDRYKQLLLKQRDIMLNLTTRLNERDETILQLQEEVDAYDAHVQTLEDTLEALQQQSQLHNSPGNNKAPAAAPTQPPTLSASQMEDLMRRELRGILQERAETLVRREIDAQHWQLCQELEAAEARASTAELRCRELTSSVSNPQTNARRMAEEQQEVLRRAFEGRVSALQHQLSQERERRMRLTADVDRLLVESRQALERCANAAQRAEFSDICEALLRAEAFTRAETAQSVAETISRTKALHVSSPLGTKTVEKDARQELAERDAHIRQLQEQLRTSAAREEEVASLTKSLHTHKKDRRALQTIMEQRIKVKIDAICELIEAGPQLPQQERSRLGTEARALQNLVHASIKAMES